MADRKRPQRSPDRPAYPRREMLAILGAASLPLIGCEDKPSAPAIPDESVAAPPATPEIVQPEVGSTPSPSAAPASPVTKRLPATGHRMLSLGPFETVHYAVTMKHSDPRFAEFAEQHTPALLNAADAALRALPPHQYRDRGERAKYEAKIAEKVEELLSKEATIEQPLTEVLLDVARIDRRPRRTAGIPARH